MAEPGKLIENFLQVSVMPWVATEVVSLVHKTSIGVAVSVHGKNEINFKQMFSKSKH